MVPEGQVFRVVRPGQDGVLLAISFYLFIYFFFLEIDLLRVTLKDTPCGRDDLPLGCRGRGVYAPIVF